MAEKKSDEELRGLVKEMRDWLNSQPHLPKDVDDMLLLRFIHSCYYDMKRAKAAAEKFFTIRGSAPELMTFRDPRSPSMQKMLSALNLAQLSVSGNRNLWIWQLNDPGMEKYDYVDDAKVFLLSTDAWLLENTELEEADIVIMDVKDVTLKLLTKLNMSVARKLSKYEEDAMPIRLKQIHIINAPSYIDKLFGVLKSMLKQDILEMIHFHTPRSETLYQYISKEDLPQDYGGELDKMENHMKHVFKLLEKHRDSLLNPNLWCATSDKKSKNKNKHDTQTDVSTSFRSLAID